MGASPTLCSLKMRNDKDGKIIWKLLVDKQLCWLGKPWHFCYNKLKGLFMRYWASPSNLNNIRTCAKLCASDKPETGASMLHKHTAHASAYMSSRWILALRVYSWEHIGYAWRSLKTPAYSLSNYRCCNRRHRLVVVRILSVKIKARNCTVQAIKKHPG